MNTGGPASEKTLLDEFAGQALAGLIASGKYDPCLDTGAVAYDQAGHMLAEKARREEVMRSACDQPGVALAVAALCKDHSPDAGRMAVLEAINRELVEELEKFTKAVEWFLGDGPEVRSARAILAKAKGMA